MPPVKTCFATVGSTQFTSLVEAVLSPASLSALASQGFTRLVVQYGHSTLPGHWANPSTSPETGNAGVTVELFKFKDGIEDCVREADLVVGHAGELTHHPPSPVRVAHWPVNPEPAGDLRC